MKRILFFILTGLYLIIGVTSCFNDEGNYDYVDLPDFYVDTTGIISYHLVTQFETLAIPSRLVYAGDKSGLDFIWAIYRSGGGQSTVTADTLAHTENFSAPITVTPGSYYLEFCAIERATGVRATQRYSLTVESANGAGLLAFYQKNGAGDCDLIRTPLFISALQESSVKRSLYTQANPGHPLTGEPIRMGTVSSGTNQYINLLTESDIVRLSAIDMTITFDFNGIFWTAPSVCKPEGWYFSGDELLINDGLAYVTIVGWSNGMPLFPGPKVLMNGEYRASPHGIISYANCVIIYDELAKRFLHCTEWSSELTLPSTGGAFDMTSVGKEQLYLDNGFTDVSATYYGYSVMQTPGNPAQRSLYVFKTNGNASNCSGVAVIDLSTCPAIAQANLFAVSSLGPILYYATDNSIYKSTFGLSDQSLAAPSAASWTCPAGETVTCMRLFKHAGIGLSESAVCKYLLVATWNGSEGKVYIFSANIASGELSAAPVETYGQFGHIKDLQFKAQ